MKRAVSNFAAAGIFIVGLVLGLGIFYSTTGLSRTTTTLTATSTVTSTTTTTEISALTTTVAPIPVTTTQTTSILSNETTTLTSFSTSTVNPESDAQAYLLAAEENIQVEFIQLSLSGPLYNFSLNIFNFNSYNISLTTFHTCLMTMEGNNPSCQDGGQPENIPAESNITLYSLGGGGEPDPGPLGAYVILSFSTPDGNFRMGPLVVYPQAFYNQDYYPVELLESNLLSNDTGTSPLTLSNPACSPSVVPLSVSYLYFTDNANSNITIGSISLSYGGTNETLQIPAGSGCVMSYGQGVVVSFSSLGAVHATEGEAFNGTATLVGGSAVKFVGTFY